MKFEIERKFLLKNDGWKAGVHSICKLSDGLLSNFNGNKVRVRIADKQGTITVKGPRTHASRVELEYDIPLAEAEYMLSKMCGADICTKVRHFVPHGLHVWHVDVYEGLLDGVVTAEIELNQSKEKFLRPGWIGREVTGNASYGKWEILARYISADCANKNFSDSGWHFGTLDIESQNLTA